MTVEEIIFSALRGLVDDRVFPDVADMKTPMPFITYQQVGGEPVNFLDGAIPDRAHGRFQINAWAPSRMEAKDLAGQAERALRLAPLQTSVLGSPVAVYDAETKARGTQQDFSLWSSTA